MKKYLFFILALGLFSCGDDLGLPDCIDDKLSTFKDEAFCQGDNLTSWELQGQKVYCFVDGICGVVGASIDIFDEECNLICTRRDTCQGVSWQENATNRLVIWEKE